ncbi:SGNH/GDSL hydrolase family protein [Novosphingobium sp. BW1]|uniref:SGNH/GDSL hydrolase family protein n=1 Tax=Novosphingobium sp. BW1 TaxID=2592621 RepID=UPI0011DEC025|nr:SGNH/GDSL hydrolase family protein [Novosphingobium sp. BW1]TYC94765.1 SGNH/GDSL hydrolase family protein [Novosphingobium sp. BW1]
MMKSVCIATALVGTLYCSDASAAKKLQSEVHYVALGSSYAAGIGLGDKVPNSPPVCMRGEGSYPRVLAQIIGARLTDASCSGSTTKQILDKRQAGLDPQIQAVTKDTDLVTITVGGNDLGYVGDMMRTTGLFGGLQGQLRSASARPYTELRKTIVAVLREVRKRAPKSRIILVTYPDVLPENGTCERLGLNAGEADTFREIAKQLAATTRSAARSIQGTQVVDAARQSKGHDACSAQPWTTGSHPNEGFAFHPTSAGAQAVAELIEKSLS